MWPPPPRHVSIQQPIPLPQSSYGMVSLPQSSYHHIYQHPPDPYIDRINFGGNGGSDIAHKAPWHREFGATWRLPPSGEDWRSLGGGGGGYQSWSS
jgi:hypothetical protein